MREITYPARLAYRGVLIERPCVHCDTTDLHFDGRCQHGPCTVCGLPYRTEGWPTHPVDEHGEYRSSLPMHEFSYGSYAPADFEAEVPAAFDALVSLVRFIGWPEHFTSDLFRDYQMLSRQGLYHTTPPRRFIFAVRPTGTDIILPHADVMSEPRLRSNERFFVWNEVYLPGLGFIECTEEQARILLREWHADEQRALNAAPRCHGPSWHDATCTHQMARA
jgi:hypothetical protein